MGCGTSIDYAPKQDDGVTQSKFENMSPDQWDQKLMLEWLIKIRLPKCAKKFKKHNITGDLLYTLTDDDLNKMGIYQRGDIIRFRKERDFLLSQWQSKCRSYSTETVPMKPSVSNVPSSNTMLQSQENSANDGHITEKQQNHDPNKLYPPLTVIDSNSSKNSLQLSHQSHQSIPHSNHSSSKNINNNNIAGDNKNCQNEEIDGHNKIHNNNNCNNANKNDTVNTNINNNSSNVTNDNNNCNDVPNLTLPETQRTLPLETKNNYTKEDDTEVPNDSNDDYQAINDINDFETHVDPTQIIHSSGPVYSIHIHNGNLSNCNNIKIMNDHSIPKDVTNDECCPYEHEEKKIHIIAYSLWCMKHMIQTKNIQLENINELGFTGQQLVLFIKKYNIVPFSQTNDKKSFLMFKNSEEHVHYIRNICQKLLDYGYINLIQPKTPSLSPNTRKFLMSNEAIYQFNDATFYFPGFACEGKGDFECNNDIISKQLFYNNQKNNNSIDCYPKSYSQTSNGHQSPYSYVCNQNRCNYNMFPSNNEVFQYKHSTPQVDFNVNVNPNFRYNSHRQLPTMGMQQYHQSQNYHTSLPYSHGFCQSNVSTN